MPTNNSWNSQNPAQVVFGGTGAATLTGVLIGNGTSAVTANSITQYNTLVGGTSNTISSISPGTNGQILTSGGASANPAYAALSGGTMVALSTQTATSSASIAFTSLITSTYNTYKVIYYNVYPATDNTTLNLDLSTDNGGSYLNASFLAGTLSNPYNSTTFTNTNSTTTIPVAALQSNVTTNSPICGYMDLFNFPSVSTYPVIVANSGFFISGATFNENAMVGTNTANMTITAIKFSFSSGNIASGTFVLYGIKES